MADTPGYQRPENSADRIAQKREEDRKERERTENQDKRHD